MLRLYLHGGFSLTGADGAEIALKSQKAKALLAYLARPPGKARSREEILGLLWSDREEAQGRASLRQVLSGLRKDLGTQAEAALAISDQTVSLNPGGIVIMPGAPGEAFLEGFQLRDPAFEDWLRDERQAELPDEEGRVPAAAPAQDRTTIAALPFADLSGDPDEEFFADGVTEDLVGALAQFRHMSVVSHRTTAALRDRTSSPVEVARELGADFVLSGSVRRAGQRVRVSVQLVDGESGAQVWSDRLDRDLDDIFAVQDEIVAAVAGRLSFSLADVATEQRLRDPARSGTAYTYFLKGRAAWREGREAAALRNMEHAIRVDPEYPRALADAAYFHAYGLFSMANGLSEEECHRLARDRIGRALGRERNDAFVFHRSAMVYGLLGDPERALRYAETATRLNGSDPTAIVVHGWCLTICGRVREGLPMIERAIAIEPHAPPGFYSALADARYMAGDFEGCLAALEGILDTSDYVRLYRVPSLVRLGRKAEAKAILAAASTGFDQARFARALGAMCLTAELSELWLEPFRLAGVDV